MKRLVGGDFLLDMSPIELEKSVDGTTKTNITDNEVLGQLTDLKRFIGSPSMVKPIWCKLTNGETDELIVARGTLAVVDVGEFEICIPLDGYKLKISVEFTQAETEDHTPLDDWYIDTNDAKYILTSDKQEVTAIIGEGDIPNAKPIYFHPIRLDIVGESAGQTFRVKGGSVTIINNESTPINTFTKIKEYMRDNEVDIVANIDFYASDGTYAGQILGLSYDETLPDNIVVNFTVDGVNYVRGVFSSGELTPTSDVVNKIN